MNIADIQLNCKNYMVGLVDKGVHICKSFSPRQDATLFCRHCGYSDYAHLCREIVEAEE